MLNKREFVTGTIAAATLATAAKAQAPVGNGLNPPRAIPHGMMKTTPMFKYPKGYGNGLAVAPEGLWIAQQKLSGDGAKRYGLPEPDDLREAAFLADTVYVMSKRPGRIVARRSIDADCMEFDLNLPADHPAFAGHFPSRPVLPGVVQIDWAIRLAETHLGSGLSAACDYQVKFRRVIGPGPGATLELRIERARSALHFTYRDGGEIASTGRIRLDGPA